MKRKLSVILTTLIVVIFAITPFSSFASQEEKYVTVYDNANLLTDSQEESLQDDIQDFIIRYKMDFLICTITENDGLSAEKYAEKFYNSHTNHIGNDDGIIVLIDMKDRKFYIRTNEKATDYFAQAKIDSMVSDLGTHLKNADYYGGVKGVFDTVNIAMQKANSSQDVSPTQKVVDNAELFSADETEMLEKECLNIVNSYDMDMVVLTTRSTDGKSQLSYSKNFFNTNKYGLGKENSGVLLLIDMQNLEFYMTTFGEGKNYFDVDRISDITTSIKSNLDNKKFASAMAMAIDKINGYIQDGYSDNYNPGGDVEVESKFDEFLNALFWGIIIGLVATAIAVGVEKSHQFKNDVSNRTYLKPGSDKINVRQDFFVREFTTSRRIERDSGGSSGGGSSSSGGGGGSFSGGGSGGGGGSF